MGVADELDARGRALLADMAADPESARARAFDSLYYEIVWRYLRTNHRKLGSRVARYMGLGAGSIAPQVMEYEVDEVAHDATTVALRRVRQKAWAFDARRGSPTGWVIGAAEYAYTEIAKEIVRARRSEQLVFMDPVHLLREAGSCPSAEDQALGCLGDAAALAEAAKATSEKEFVALRLRITLGYSRAETARAIFGDSSMTKQVDGLVERGARKLARAWADRMPSAGVGTNVSQNNDEKEQADE